MLIDDRGEASEDETKQRAPESAAKKQMRRMGGSKAMLSHPAQRFNSVDQPSKVGAAFGFGPGALAGGHASARFRTAAAPAFRQLGAHPIRHHKVTCNVGVDVVKTA
jgi:hypothetical protein